MKKAIAHLLCLVLCLSFLSSCGKPTVYYKSYAISISAGLDTLDQMPDYRSTFYTHQFWPYITEHYESNNNAAAKLSVKVGDLQLDGEYVGIEIDPELSYLLDRYTSDIYSFAVHPSNRQLVSFRTPFSKPNESNEKIHNYFNALRALPDLEKPQEDSQRIAQELAKEYIDPSKYQLEYCGKSSGVYYVTDLQGEQWRFDVYNYRLVKYINDIPTSDYLSISITSKGSIYKIKRGEIDAFKGIDFEIPAVKESIGAFLEEAWAKYPFNVVRSEVDQQEIRLTMDQQPAVYTTLHVDLKDKNGDEHGAWIEMVTLFSTDPNKVIATRPNPFLYPSAVISSRPKTPSAPFT